MLLFKITGVIAVMVFFKDAYHYGIYNTYLCVCVYIYHITMFVQNRNNFALL